MVNGKQVQNVRPSGYFCQAVFLGDDQLQVVVEAEHTGWKRSVHRTFKLAD